MNNNTRSCELSKEDVLTLCRYGARQSFPKNRSIYCEGDEANSVYYVRAGRVKILLSDEHGKEKILNYHGVGEYFGELALLDDGMRNTSATAVEATTVISISRHQFASCLSTRPDLEDKIVRGLAIRMRELTEELRRMSMLTVYGRLRALLYELGREHEDGQVCIEDRLTHQDIANRVGAGREMVTRTLGELKKGGYIRTDRGRAITIIRPLPAHF